MHFDFHFTAVQILWTLTFAALLVLLVVLLGRDRARRFPWFTAAMVTMAVRMLASRLLFGRLPQVIGSEIFLALADLAAILAVLVAVEMARRAFAGARRTTWIVWTLVVLAVAGVVLAEWGPWPSYKTLLAGSELSVLRLMQLIAQKTDLLADVLIIQLSLLIVLFGRRFHAGWRSHTQQIVIGLSTASIAQLAVRSIWQEVATHVSIRSQAEYNHVMDLQDKFYNANSAVFLAVQVWWIVCLWIDEPGGARAEDSDQEAADSEELAASEEDPAAKSASEEPAATEAAEANVVGSGSSESTTGEQGKED
jgi:hypothetical protein